MNRLLTSHLIIIIFSSLALLKIMMTWEDPAQHINCVGNASFYKYGMTMQLSIKLNYTYDRGIIYLIGGIYSGSTRISSVDRAIEFRASHIGHQFTLTSTDINSSMEEQLDPVLAPKWLPDFYTIRGSSTRININRININSLMISNEIAPYYICSRP